MRLCSGCHRREADHGYQKCTPCRERNNQAQRAYYARQHTMHPEPTRSRALTLLTTFVMTPRDLSCALDIPTAHASVVLYRLWQQGKCERWPHRGNAYRYRLRDAA